MKSIRSLRPAAQAAPPCGSHDMPADLPEPNRSFPSRSDTQPSEEDPACTRPPPAWGGGGGGGTEVRARFLSAVMCLRCSQGFVWFFLKPPPPLQSRGPLKKDCCRAGIQPDIWMEGQGWMGTSPTSRSPGAGAVNPPLPRPGTGWGFLPAPSLAQRGGASRCMSGRPRRSPRSRPRRGGS